MVGRRGFGVWTLAFLVVANMVGAGVFTTSGFTLAALGSSGWVLAAWVAGGLVALAGAAGYAELSVRVPGSGGEYLFLSRAAHPLLGFVAGWISIIAGFSGALAFAATALESYLFPEALRPGGLPQDAVAVGVVILCGLAHGLRVDWGARLQNVAVGLKLVLLAGFLVFALSRTGSGAWWGGGRIEGPDPMAGWAGVPAFAEALVWISLSYSGFNAAVYVAGESAGARSDVPRALGLGTLVVCLLYWGLNAVFVYGPEPALVAGQPDVAAVAARALGGGVAADWVRGIVVLALLTSALSLMMAAPRVYAVMARDGWLPAWVGAEGAGGPRGAILLQAGVAILLILLSSLRGLLSYLGLTLSLSAACSVACLFMPGQRRGTPVVRLLLPGFYVVATLVLALFMAWRQPMQFLAAALTFGSGAALYAVLRRRRG